MHSKEESKSFAPDILYSLSLSQQVQDASHEPLPTLHCYDYEQYNSNYYNITIILLLHCNNVYLYNLLFCYSLTADMDRTDGSP